MKIKSTYRIDADALKVAFRKHHTTAAAACREMGYSATYFSTCYSRGWISKQGMVMLQTAVGIAPEEYVIDNDIEPSLGVDYDRMYDIALRACRTAIKEALS